MTVLQVPVEATNAFDREILEFMRHNSSDDLDHVMRALSNEWNKPNMALATLAVTAWGDDQSFMAAQECIKAAALSEAVVGPLKYAVSRKRPTGTHSRSNSSFPSSHAASSFAVASTIGHIYPDFKLPVYAVASLVACSRIYNQRHYATDVLAGALIGVVAARTSRAYLGWLAIERRDITDALPLRLSFDSKGNGLGRIYLSRRL